MVRWVLHRQVGTLIKQENMHSTRALIWYKFIFAFIHLPDDKTINE